MKIHLHEELLILCQHHLFRYTLDLFGVQWLSRSWLDMLAWSLLGFVELLSSENSWRHVSMLVWMLACALSSVKDNWFAKWWLIIASSVFCFLVFNILWSWEVKSPFRLLDSTTNLFLSIILQIAYSLIKEQEGQKRVPDDYISFVGLLADPQFGGNWFVLLVILLQSFGQHLLVKMCCHGWMAVAVGMMIWCLSCRPNLLWIHICEFYTSRCLFLNEVNKTSCVVCIFAKEHSSQWILEYKPEKIIISNFCSCKLVVLSTFCVSTSIY